MALLYSGFYRAMLCIVVVVVAVVVVAVVVVVRKACTRRHNYRVNSAPPSRLSLRIVRTMLISARRNFCKRGKVYDDNNNNKCKKLQFIHKLTSSDTSKTAKITKK